MLTMARTGRRRESKGQRRRREREAANARVRAVAVPPVAAYSSSEWADENGAIGSYIYAESAKTLESYRAQPALITEHANQEHDLARGGYANRQVLELTQNAADQISSTKDGTIQLHLTQDHFYCADNGEQIDEEGARALLFSHLSPKRGTDRIGRFGLGFKSVLGVTDSPEFLSRSGSFRWNREQAERQLRDTASDLPSYPILRIAEAIDPHSLASSDPVLKDLMSWAKNVVRLPLLPNARGRIQNQLAEFPAEFLLFVPHVSLLEIIDTVGEDSRRITCKISGDTADLTEGDTTTRWLLASTVHQLSSDAIADKRTLDGEDEEANEVRITWAAPSDRLNEPGRFWAYFPTLTQSLLSGILNAPWKTNEDRQNLLSGVYNDELIADSAQIVADALPQLSTQDDPARHLVALPRRSDEDAGNIHASRLRDALLTELAKRAVIPNQNGELRSLQDVSYPPSEIFEGRQNAPDAIAHWARFQNRPSEWLHHRALTFDRFFKIGQLWRSISGDARAEQALPRATIRQWLEALVANTSAQQNVTIEAIEASRAAIQTAALIPAEIRHGEDLGEIVLTADGRWVEPDPRSVFLGGTHSDSADSVVHPDLENDTETAEALTGLGIRPASGAAVFEQLAKTVLGSSPYGKPYSARDWHEFWVLAEDVETDTAAAIIRNSSTKWRDVLHISTIDGAWHTLHEALMPGTVVPGDGSRDSDVAINTSAYHSNSDVALLRALGAADGPASGFPIVGAVREGIERARKQQFTQQHQLTYDRRPQEPSLVLANGHVSGPLPVLGRLSDEARALYTWKLLEIDSTYKNWTMRHNVISCSCEPMSFPSPMVRALLQYGRIETIGGIFPLADGIGDPPANLAVRERLLEHPNGDAIRAAFGIPETLTVSDPDLEEDDEYEDDEVDTDSSTEDVDTARDTIRLEAKNEADRLLHAVGERALRLGLPQGLLTILEREKGAPLDGLEVAEAAISTFHTGALEEYKNAIGHLDPPKRWAGGPQVVAFVQSLGFGEEWAGKRANRREAFLEVDGPLTLPPLHDFQRFVADNTRKLLTTPTHTTNRRGMISMPTGSGKTRVAVQAIVEAIRDDGIASGVLWVADKDELCEQAVQAWREVWASEGLRDTALRISRLWQGQQAPLPVTEFHVVVASIQTLYSRIDQSSYRFLSDFDLVVFDEAHRSVAPTFTGVMEELGLTRYRRAGEPILIGLTATPYRGYDAEETQRLVNRYSANRLDAGAFRSGHPEDVVRELQEMEVLAAADHETILGGSFELTPEELGELRTFSRFPETAGQRIGQDPERTRRILDAYHHINPEWPTLVFATSVEHSKIVAAMLNREGITARAVWAATKPSVRRGIVEGFRDGRIKALVNYGVFREGFDAPKTRAVIVARPVYSPNLYFQMIGRGLRGVKNGGNDRCLILNVEDNIENYEGRLAFSELDWLWDEPSHP